METDMIRFQGGVLCFLLDTPVWCVVWVHEVSWMIPLSQKIFWKVEDKNSSALSDLKTLSTATNWVFILLKTAENIWTLHFSPSINISHSYVVIYKQYIVFVISKIWNIQFNGPHTSECTSSNG